MNLKTKINLAYFGSPSFSADFLEKILTDSDLKKIIDVKLVVTQPDKPAGRKQILTETPVKKVAKKYGIEIFEIQNLNLKSQNDNLKLKIKSFDLCLVYAFSQIIPKDLINTPKLGFWNIHPSLLPKYRGPSPIAYSLIFGEKETGITIIKMDEKIDHGPIIAQEKLKIESDDRRPDLEKKLTDLGFKTFKRIILKEDNPQIVPQNHTQATYTRLLKKEDGFLPLFILKKALKNESLKFEELPTIVKEYLTKNPKLKVLNSKQKVIPAKVGMQENYIDSRFQGNDNQLRISSKIIYDYFRGLSPWPGIWTILPNGKRLKIIDMNFHVTRFTLHVTRVQLEGKKEVDFETFNRAHHIF